MIPLFQLDLYDKDRNWKFPVGAFVSLEGTKRVDNISDLDFTVKATHNRLDFMMTPGTRVRCKLRGETLIEGPIRGWGGDGPGVSGEFTFSVEDNFRILRNFLIYQVPGGDMPAQAGAYHYTQTGPVETVFKDIVNLNIAARGIEPIIIATDLGRGGVVTAQARMAKIYNEMFPLLEANGLAARVTASPAGLTVDVYEPGVYPNVLSEGSRIVKKWKARVEAPDVTHVVVGGQGQAEARTFISATDTTREALWGDRIEMFQDARDASDLNTYDERAEESLFEGQGSASIEVVLAETKNFKFGGPDGLNVGQIVTAKVANNKVEVTDILREIDFSWNAEDGLRLKGTIGRKVDPSAQVVYAISKLAGSLNKLKASE